MLNETNREMCNLLLDRYGNRAQMVVAMEEMSELTKEICKMLRSGERGCTEGFKEELADVLVMMEQLRLMYDIFPSEINERARKKLERAIRRGRE